MYRSASRSALWVSARVLRRPSTRHCFWEGPHPLPGAGSSAQRCASHSVRIAPVLMRIFQPPGRSTPVKMTHGCPFFFGMRSQQSRGCRIRMLSSVVETRSRNRARVCSVPRNTASDVMSAEARPEGKTSFPQSRFMCRGRHTYGDGGSVAMKCLLRRAPWRKPRRLGVRPGDYGSIRAFVMTER